MQVAVKLLRGFDGGDAGDVIADFLEEAKARAAALRPRHVATALSDAAMRHVALRCKHFELLQSVVVGSRSGVLQPTWFQPVVWRRATTSAPDGNLDGPL